MASETGFDTLVSDLRFLLDLEPTSPRLTTPQAERLLNKSRDKLFGILAEAYGDDYFTYCVGVQISPTAPVTSYCRTITLGVQGAALGYWHLGLRGALGKSPSPGSPDIATPTIAAPQFHRLRKVQMPESWTAAGTGTGPGYDIIEGTGAEYDAVMEWSGKLVDLQRSNLDRLNSSESARAWSIQRPPTYRLIADGQMGSSLYFDPAPTEAVAVLVWYVGNPLDLTSTNPSTLSPGWADWLIYDAAVTFAIRDRDSSVELAELRQERARLEASIQEQARDRDDGQPLQIRRTYMGGLGDAEARDWATFGR